MSQRIDDPQTTSAGESLPPLGSRALTEAQQELDNGVKEVPPGSNTGPRIRTYFAGCQRGGRPLGLTTGNWCAAFASWCAYQAAAPGELPPHGWRAAVAELWADALANGAAKKPGASYVPQVGDLAIFARAGGDPTKGGTGHVGRVVQPPDASGTYTTIEGNHNDAVGLAHHEAGDEVGWIAYPRSASTDSAVGGGALLAATSMAGSGPDFTG